MKKLLLSIITLLAFTPIFAVDLSDIIGTYTGLLKVTLGEDGEMPDTEGVKVNVTKETETTFKVSLKDFAFLGIVVGDIEVGGATIDSEGNITAPQVTLDKTAEGLGKLPTTLSGTLNGKTANLKILVLWNSTGSDDEPNWAEVHVDYNGTKDTTAGINNANANGSKLVQNGNILTVDGAGINSFKIYNMSGSLVAAKSHHATAINIDALPYGIYIVKILTDNQQTITRKIYKK